MISAELLVRLVDDHAAALELYAAQWAESPADVVQIAFIRLASQPVVPDNVRAWLYRVVRNGAISAARSASRRRRHEMFAASLTGSWFQRNDDNEIDAQNAAV